MRQAEFARHVGAENICGSVTDALERAAQVHSAVKEQDLTHSVTDS
jgi:hypothetical protein